MPCDHPAGACVVQQSLQPIGLGGWRIKRPMGCGSAQSAQPHRLCPPSPTGGDYRPAHPLFDPPDGESIGYLVIIPSGLCKPRTSARFSTIRIMISSRYGTLSHPQGVGRSESAAAHKGPSLQAPPGTRGLRIRPRRFHGANCGCSYHRRRQPSPACGWAAPGPAPFDRPRPPKACSPLRSSVLFVCPSAPRPGATRPPSHRRQRSSLQAEPSPETPSGE